MVWIGRIVIVLAGLVGLMAIFGPREEVERVAFTGDVGNYAAAYLAEVEGRFDDIVPGVEKRIVWAGPEGEMTDIAVLYVHGFSGTSEEVRPLPDRVAERLGANLVFTRLTGHGRGGPAMAEARAGDWIADIGEAMAVARKVGRGVLVMSSSTGATLTAVAATDSELSQGMMGQIMLSPNFAIRHGAARIVTWPGARWWLPIVAGRQRSFAPLNADHARYWTTRYPTAALLPMAALVRHAAGLDYSDVTIPALMIFSDADQVVSASATRAMARRWGGPVTLSPVSLGEGDDPSSHVIAGDILSPGMTDAVSALILDWVERLDG